MQASIQMRAFSAVRPVAVRPAPAAARPRSLVVVAVKPTKISEFADLDAKEIIEKMKTLKVQLASNRFLMNTQGVSVFEAGAKRPAPQPENMPKAHTFKHLRRQVAQLSTILRQMQIADGITRRMAKKIEKHAALAAGYPTHL